MSEILYPRTRNRSLLRLRLAALATAAALVLTLLAGWLGLSFLGVISGHVRIEAQLTTTGDSLGINSDVKFRGLRVGRVVAVEHGSTPTAEILIHADHVDAVPGDVLARVLPGTLFGNEYVDLVAPKASVGTAAPLTDGAVVAADTSTRTLRLMDTLAATQRLLGAVDPARLQVALAELAGAVDGRGTTMAAFISDADTLLADWARDEPQLWTDLELLATNVETLADVEPQLVGAIRDSLPVARTWAEKEKQTTRTLRRTTALTRSVGDFLGTQIDVVARLLDHSAALLRVFASRSASFDLLLKKVPPVLENGAAAVRDGRIQMDATIGTQMLGHYTVEDCPRYGSMPGGNCGGGR